MTRPIAIPTMRDSAGEPRPILSFEDTFKSHENRHVEWLTWCETQQMIAEHEILHAQNRDLQEPPF